MNSHILAGKTIIIAEDDLFLSNVITKKLELYGAAVVQYVNGEDCLRAIHNKLPDLVLLDIDLPGKNGYSILEDLNQAHIIPTLPIIVISNSGQAIKIEKILSLGIRDYIIKANFQPDDVVSKVFDALSIEFPSKKFGTSLTIEDSSYVLDESQDIVRVLVVEDDPLLRNMLSVKLANSHCPHMFSNDGLQALELTSQFEPHVIVLDLMIPGKDGFTVLSELKADVRYAKIPVVIFSNKSGDDEKTKAIELGASAYRVKAMTDLNELVFELRRLARMS